MSCGWALTSASVIRLGFASDRHMYIYIHPSHGEFGACNTCPRFGFSKPGTSNPITTPIRPFNNMPTTARPTETQTETKGNLCGPGRGPVLSHDPKGLASSPHLSERVSPPPTLPAPVGPSTPPFFEVAHVRLAPGGTDLESL